MYTIKYNLILLFFLLIASCKSKIDNETIFKKVDKEKSLIEFENKLTESDSLNYFTYTYLYI